MSFLDPATLDKMSSEDIFKNRKNTDHFKILKQKKDLILRLILDPSFKVNETKFSVYSLFKEGRSHSEISKLLNISEQVSKNYNSEVKKKIMSIAEILDKI